MKYHLKIVKKLAFLAVLSLPFCAQAQVFTESELAGRSRAVVKEILTLREVYREADRTTLASFHAEMELLRVAATAGELSPAGFARARAAVERMAATWFRRYCRRDESDDPYWADITNVLFAHGLPTQQAVDQAVADLHVCRRVLIIRDVASDPGPTLEAAKGDFAALLARLKAAGPVPPR